MTEKLNLVDNGVDMITYPQDLHRSVNKTAALWKQFCQLPPDIKALFTATNNHNGTGYEFKDGKGTSHDSKENFDYSSLGLSALERQAQASGNDVARQFINTIKLLDEEAAPMIEEFGRQLESHYGVHEASKLVEQSTHEAFFRFLHYPSGGAVGDIIAEAHTDHSGLTFHLYESTEGCERLTLDRKNWEPLPVTDTEAAAFLGMQSQLASGSELKALTHQVIVNETTVKFGRYAIVCFVALKGVPGYDRMTHGRLQEMHKKDLGFNYTMPQQEFSTLFNKF